MPVLTKQAILATTPRLQQIDVPEWGGSVYIRPMTIKEQANLADLGTKFEKASVLDRARHITLTMIQWSVCDENGQALFEKGDLDALLNKAASAFLRLQDAILGLSGLTKEAREELEKNLLSAQTDSSNS